MNRKKALLASIVTCAGITVTTQAQAAGGPLGIDHRLALDEHGIWARNDQKALQYVVVGGVLLGALWEGSDTRFGKTLWQSTDSMIVGTTSYLILNNTLRRQRPYQSDSPNQWFKSKGHSFPSGEVTAISSAITPLVLEYGPEQPAAYALELLPLYDSVARMKSQAHWQTDVLAAWALGTASGYYAHGRNAPFTVGFLPRGLTVGWHTKF